MAPNETPWYIKHKWQEQAAVKDKRRAIVGVNAVMVCQLDVASIAVESCLLIPLLGKG